MKTQLSFIAIVILLITTSWVAPIETKDNNKKAVVQSSTATPIMGFNSFRTHRQGRFGITSTWDVSSENGVMSYVLLRTYEDPTDPYANWETVTITPAINARSYKFTDANVFPGFISYCVVANMTGGGEVTSPVSTIRILSH